MVKNVDLSLTYLPEFARWIVESHLDKFSRLMLEFSRRENVPLLNLFSGFSDDQLIEMGKVSGQKLLSRLASNNAAEHINITVKEWISNKLKNVERSSIVAEDIILISLVRRKVFRVMAETYTWDTARFRKIMDEVDRFTAASDIAALEAYIKIHQEEVQQVNLKLQAQREELLEAQQLSQIGSFYWDIEGKGRSVFTPMVMKIFELEETGTLDSFILDVHPDDRDRLKQAIAQAINNNEIYECEYRYSRNNIKKRIWSRGVVLHENGKPMALKGTVMDTTIKSELLDKLKESEVYLAQLIDNAPDAIIVIDENSVIQLWNPKSEQIFGWKPTEVIGRHLADIIIPPRYREAHNSGMRRFIKTGVGTVINRTTEVVGVNKRNEELFVSLTVSETFQQGSRVFIAFLRDITKEKQIQIELKNKTLLLEQRNLQLEHSNQELESFNYAASHDLQEPLRKIRIFANRIIEEKSNIDPQIRIYTEKIISSSTRMQQLIDDLLRFSQTTSASEEEKVISLADVLNDAIKTVSDEIEETGAIITNSVLPSIRVIPFQFHQLFVNLLSNSIKYRKPGAKPEIWIGAVGVKVGKVKQVSTILPGNYVKLSFADKGIGFDPQYSERLFDLFVRLHNKEKYVGTGIGLAICKKIVQNHQGFLIAESDGHSGSTFHIYIPEERSVNSSTAS